MARRANRDGSIYQRSSDGRWSASLSLPNGKRHHFLGHRRDQVHEKMIAFQKAQQDGLPIITERQTVRQYLIDWLESPSKRRPRTSIRYEELLRLHVFPHIGSIQLAKLTPQQVQGLYGILEKKLAAATVHQVHAILHKAFKKAVGWNLMHRNPTDYTERTPIVRGERPVLSPADVRAFLEAAVGTRFEALFVLAVMTGMREGELLGLRWQDVDLDSGILQVRHQIQRLDREWRFVEPKSEKSRRTLVLPGPSIDALRRHRLKQNEERLKMGSPWIEMDLVFANEIGKPMEVGNLTQRYFRPLLAKAGLPIIRFHDLRHTAGSLMLGASVDVKVVSEMLGHSHPAFTMHVYQHVNLEMQQKAAAAVEAILG